jgi:aryl-alcohol dehydrogenase-like predicted oxidoreductase
MEYRTLGRTGLRVSEIGLRTFHDFRKAAASNENLCIAIVNEALAKGINFIDTASVYGESERVLMRPSSCASFSTCASYL